MNKTNLERYGRTNVGQFGTEEHNEAIKNKYNVEFISQAEIIKEKTKKTNLQKYGCENVFQAQTVKEKCKQTNLIKYGHENCMQSDEIKTKLRQTCLEKYELTNGGWSEFAQIKIKQTNLEKYGTEYFWQSSYYQKTAHKKYYYDNIYFDSSWELALWIFAKDHNEEIERCPIKFEYYVGDKLHYYFPDFRYKNQIIEIKGNQFLDENGMLKVCYNNMTGEIVKAKHRCILDNKVEIWPKNKVQFALDYIKQTYGKDYLKQFKTNSERKE